jgi:hypothetical protein
MMEALLPLFLLLVRHSIDEDVDYLSARTRWAAGNSCFTGSGLRILIDRLSPAVVFYYILMVGQDSSCSCTVISEIYCASPS